MNLVVFDLSPMTAMTLIFSEDIEDIMESVDYGATFFAASTFIPENVDALHLIEGEKVYVLGEFECTHC